MKINNWDTASGYHGVRFPQLLHQPLTTTDMSINHSQPG